MFCKYCNNAFVDDSLTDNNDLSYISIGHIEKGYTLYFRSGDNRFTGIDISHFFPGRQCSNTIGYYVPKYCPECGRYLKENEFYRELQNNKEVK